MYFEKIQITILKTNSYIFLHYVSERKQNLHHHSTPNPKVEGVILPFNILHQFFQIFKFGEKREEKMDFFESRSIIKVKWNNFAEKKDPLLRRQIQNSKKSGRLPSLTLFCDREGGGFNFGANLRESFMNAPNENPH